MENKRFEILISKKVVDFLEKQTEEVRNKIHDNLKKAQYQENVKFFKKLKNTDIWEFRTKFESNEFRILAFWDKTKNAFVVTTHGFVKKSQKTPPKEIQKAEKIMQLYYTQNK